MCRALVGFLRVCAVATAAVFARLADPDNPGLPALPGRWRDMDHLAEYLRGCRNDLAGPGVGIEPAIGEVLAALAGAPRCLLARMSGSGATCFGLFASEAERDAAAEAIAAGHPDWWTLATRIR